MNRSLAIFAAGLLALAACDNNKPAESKPEDPTSKNSTTNATQPTTPTAPTFADADLATRADFDDTAEKAISKTNYKTELATLETEIAKED